MLSTIKKLRSEVGATAGRAWDDRLRADAIPHPRLRQLIQRASPEVTDLAGSPYSSARWRSSPAIPSVSSGTPLSATNTQSCSAHLPRSRLPTFVSHTPPASRAT
jgi:hypothetical protein